VKTKRDDKFEVIEIKPSILLLRIWDGVEVDIKAAYEMRALLVEVSSTPKYCVLLDATNSFVVTTEARAMIADKEFGKNRIAAAFVVASLANRLIGNFFIKFHKPHSPTKLFSSQPDAIKWLEKQLASITEKTI
jgi:hypothetical protein